jgi:hypothetical protein
LGSITSKLGIAAGFEIGTDFFGVKGEIDGWIDATKGFSLTGSLKSSSGIFIFETAESSVTLTHEKLKITTAWWGLALTLESNIDKGKIEMTGTVVLSKRLSADNPHTHPQYLIPLETPDSWNIHNPLPGGDDLDLSGIGFDLSIDISISLILKQQSYAATLHVVFSFDGTELPFAIPNFDLKKYNSISKVKDYVKDFILGKNLLNLLTGSFINQLWRAAAFVLKFIENVADDRRSFKLIDTKLFTIQCQLNSAAKEGDTDVVQVLLSLDGSLLATQEFNTVLLSSGVTLTPSFDSSNILNGSPLGIKAEGQVTITIAADSYEAGGNIDLKIGGLTLFSGDVSNDILSEALENSYVNSIVP